MGCVSIACNKSHHNWWDVCPTRVINYITIELVIIVRVYSSRSEQWMSVNSEGLFISRSVQCMSVNCEGLLISRSEQCMSVNSKGLLISRSEQCMSVNSEGLFILRSEQWMGNNIVGVYSSQDLKFGQRCVKFKWNF